MSTPFTDPTIIVPFFNQIVTVSFFNFIRKRTNFMDLSNYKSLDNTIIFKLIYSQFQIMTTQDQERLQEQVKKLDGEIAHFNQKYDVQHKRIQFLKKQNEELKKKQNKDNINSEEIKLQNQELKKKNRELKSKLSDLKMLMQSVKSTTNSKTVSLRQILITNSTEEIDLPKCELTDDDIYSIKVFHNIKTLILGENNLTDYGLLLICHNMPHLKKLFLNHNKITDGGVAEIQKLKDMRCLDMRCNLLTSASLISISKLTLLTQLSLSNNNITDQNLDALAALTQLTYLDITSNKITAQGGAQIASITHLSNLYLSHNQITAECVWKYLELLTNLTVLDIRFNPLDNSDKEKLRNAKKEQLQLFL